MQEKQDYIIQPMLNGKENCSIKSCGKPTRSRGASLCEAHYYQVRRNGKITSRVIVSKECHGDFGSTEYNAWTALRGRCNNPKNKRYVYYGARGIKVCARWDLYSNFLKDMGRKPTSKHSIDRINVNGNYTPKNCRWATPIEQARNKRKRA